MTLSLVYDSGKSNVVAGVEDQDECANPWRAAGCTRAIKVATQVLVALFVGQNRACLERDAITSVAMYPSSCYEYPARALRLRTSISYLEGQKGYVVAQSGNDNTNGYSRQHGHRTIGHGPNKIHRQSAVQCTPPFVRNDMLRRANDTALGRLHRGVATVQPAHRERSPLGL